MYLKPRGTWVLVKPIRPQENDQESVVLLPEDYKRPDKPYTVVRVLEDEGCEWDKDDMLLVPTHVIRDVLIGVDTFSLIERGHVMAKVVEQ
jgi:hypothetical protein|tara:strand:+ start:187 stop:459 length:273 start_codon:yes stop_codon:yes gene_type:complete